MSEDVYAAANGPKRAEGRALFVKNRRKIAEQVPWPDGALEACERLERAYPGWWITWLPTNRIKGFERDPCFWALRMLPADAQYNVYAADPDALELEIKQTPKPWSWKLPRHT